jgi:hypothetical protein
MWLALRCARRAGVGLCISAFASFHGHAARADAATAAAPEPQPRPQRVIYRDRREFESKLAKMVADGKDRLQVITDFDFTISKVRWLSL